MKPFPIPLALPLSLLLASPAAPAFGAPARLLVDPGLLYERPAGEEGSTAAVSLAPDPLLPTGEVAVSGEPDRAGPGGLLFDPDAPLREARAPGKAAPKPSAAPPSPRDIVPPVVRRPVRPTIEPRDTRPVDVFARPARPARPTLLERPAPPSVTPPARPTRPARPTPPARPAFPAPPAPPAPPARPPLPAPAMPPSADSLEIELPER